MTFRVEKLKNPQKLSKKECMKDLYKVLGVSRSSSPQALKAAYQSKVRFFLNDSEKSTPHASDFYFNIET
jgi:DnaJ-class molecular chaperone